MDQNSATPIVPPTPPVKRVPPPLKRPAVRSARPNFTAHPLTPWAVTAAAVIVLALVILGVIPTSLRSSRPWQAVFLTNGQVYFGHVARQTLTTVVLRDVYYLQVSPPLQQREPGQADPPPDITLVKLGTELHGPTDEMRINREHVLFVERLKDDATVVRAIAAARERAAQLDAQPSVPESSGGAESSFGGEPAAAPEAPPAAAPSENP